MVRDGQLVGVDLPWGGASAEVATSQGAAVPEPGASRAVSPEEKEALARWTEELEAYFRGERLSWSEEELSFELLGAVPFERAVYKALLRVPAAATVSYGELAGMAGYPRAARAVGNAMAANPVPIVIPCHRVIRADGTLGNYGNDPAWKERLLRHEREHTGRSAPER
jgi:methylated-DNA-[protein]-cysteine S-methyltransferase